MRYFKKILDRIESFKYQRKNMSDEHDSFTPDPRILYGYEIMGFDSRNEQRIKLVRQNGINEDFYYVYIEVSFNRWEQTGPRISCEQGQILTSDRYPTFFVQGDIGPNRARERAERNRNIYHQPVVLGVEHGINFENHRYGIFGDTHAGRKRKNVIEGDENYSGFKEFSKTYKK